MLEIMRTINIATQFSRYPAGRYLADGPYSGESFRENWLIPALNSEEEVTIEFDGTRGYGSSFLEEAFGGLVRKGFKPELIKELFHFKCSDPSIKEEVIDYVEHGAAPE